MNTTELKEQIKNVDIYILDQILKDRYQVGVKILDVGCGNGRNLKWFYQPDYEIHGIDTNTDRVNSCKEIYEKQQINFIHSGIEETPYESNSFDHVICIAVLHFAKDLSQYLKMFDELLRILKPEGSLLIRTASKFGIEDQMEFIENGVYRMPGGSTRFLLDDDILEGIQKRKDLVLLEEVKTTIVRNKRAMTTLVIKKVV